MGMTDRDKKLLAIFAAVVLLGGYWFLVLGKKRSAVDLARQTRDSAQQALDTAKASAQTGKAEKKRYPVSYARLVRLGKAVPDDRDFASLLIQLTDVTATSRVFFQSLTSSEATDATASGGGATGAAGGTTCDSGAPGTTGATSVTESTPPVQPTDAQSDPGQAINDANAGAANANNDAARGAASGTEATCANAPTLTDLGAVSAGLLVTSYDLRFKGNFFDLHRVFGRLLDLVKVNNGKVKVTGRLLQITSFEMTAGSDFPLLDATVKLTGYMLPADAGATAGATPLGPSATTGTPPPPAASIGAR